MLSRRTFLGALGTGLALRSVRGEPLEGGPTTTARSDNGLLTVTYNVMRGFGWPEWNARQNLGDASAKVPALIADALAARKPDLITLCEAPDEPMVRRMAERLGMRYVFFPSSEDWPGAVLTRFPIIEQANCPMAGGSRPPRLFTRHWGRVVLNSPLGKLVVHSAHLYPMYNNIRELEATELLKVIQSEMKAGHSVLLQGDLNHAPTMSPYSRCVDAGLVDTQAAVGNGSQTTYPANMPRTRIDYIFAAGPIARQIKTCRVLFERPFRTDPAQWQSYALSDHLPVMARFAP